MLKLADTSLILINPSPSNVKCSTHYRIFVQLTQGAMRVTLYEEKFMHLNMENKNVGLVFPVQNVLDIGPKAKFSTQESFLNPSRLFWIDSK